MKKTSKILLIMVIAMALILALTLFACVESETNTQEKGAKTYTIQYTDGAGGAHTLTVEDGAVYSIEVPTKKGYTFLGLYDAEVGGTQFVSSTGVSLSGFTDKKNMTLFARFAPKEYAVVLDYQGAPVTGERRLTVAYDSDISDLPTGLVKDHMTFEGWYTEGNCGGVQIGDRYGALPIVSTLNAENFDLTTGIVTLYAGFAPETYTVTFFDETGKSEEVEVGYNTPISEVVPDFRKEGKAVLSWSKRQGDTSDLFTGKVTEDLVLYAAEWAPVITFDAAGGKAVASIVAKEGSSIALPTPVKQDYTFAGWYTAGGVKSTATEMPAESLKLTAHWNAQLIFDTNGGTAVNAISEAVGTAITLPTTEKADCIFAGWYTSDGDKYETSSMPERTYRLTAKYYKTNKKRYSATVSRQPNSSSASLNYYLKIDLSDIYTDGTQEMKFTAHFTATNNYDNAAKTLGMRWNTQLDVNAAYSVWEYIDKLSDREDHKIEHTQNITLTQPILYVFYWQSQYYVTFTDFWVEVEYPDMSTLY